MNSPKQPTAGSSTTTGRVREWRRGSAVVSDADGDAPQTTQIAGIRIDALPRGGTTTPNSRRLGSSGGHHLLMERSDVLDLSAKLVETATLGPRDRRVLARLARQRQRAAPAFLLSR